MTFLFPFSIITLSYHPYHLAYPLPFSPSYFDIYRYKVLLILDMEFNQCERGNCTGNIFRIININITLTITSSCWR